MLQDFTYIALMLVIAILVPIVAIVGVKLLAPKKPGPVKNSTYECGIEAIGSSWIQFRAQYYLFALIFVIFDIETVFLYPWAVSYAVLGFFALIEMFIFVSILVVGLVYAWRKGALEWV